MPEPALVVQHLEIEEPYAIGGALAAAGLDVVVHRSDLLGPPVVADVAGLPALVVMGGPMSATSDDGFPTRPAEVDLLARAVAAGVPTLGVCLGAQLLAAACGARVYPGGVPEVGWAPIHVTADAASDPLFSGVESEPVVLHWHGDTFDLPDGATRLASSKLYPNQAFRVGTSAWGLQFHVEVDATAVERFVAAFPDDAASAPGGAGALLAEAPARVEALGTTRDGICGRFAALAARRLG